MTTQTTGEGANGGATEATESTESTDANQGANQSSDSAESATEERSSAREVPPFAENIHGLMDDILEGVRSFTPVASVRYPRYDFVETPEAYLLVVDLPGVKRDEISVTTEGEDVVLSGKRARPDWGEGAAIRRSERPHGGFRRALRLPADVRIDDIKARLEEGVLTVSLPRHTEAHARKVDIEG